MSIKKPVVHGMEPSEVYEYVGNLGLGFGIDSTNPKPWERKREYRVCHLKAVKDIVIVDEGGSWQSYHNKLESQHEKQGQLTSSIALPNTPVSIGGGAELSRKRTESCEIYGRKFVDCKISLCPDNFRQSGLDDPDDFEARLSSWIVDRIRYHASVAQSVWLNLGRNGVDDITPRDDDRELTNYMDQVGLDGPDLRLAVAAARQTMVEGDQIQQQSVAASNRQQIIATEWVLLVDLCAEFVRYFNITHFVSAIELGAAEYQVKQETTEVSEKSASANFAVFESIKATAHASSRWKKFSESMDTKKLGLVRKGGEVERLSVLDVSVLPITDRVRTAYLRQALQRALDKYINDHYQDIDHQFKKGPFKIMIKRDNPPNYYLHVYWDDDTEASSFKTPADLGEEFKQTDKKRPTSRQKSRQAVKGATLHRSLQATDDEAQAARFFLIPVDDKEEDEYYIVYYHGDLPTKGEWYVPPSSSESIPYYLQADSNLAGWKLKDSLQFVAYPNKHCKFRFMRSVSQNNSSRSSLLKDAQDESIYIRCPRHWIRTSYVHMHKSDQEEPIIGCMNKKVTNNDDSLFFLFNLCLVRPPPPQDKI